MTLTPRTFGWLRDGIGNARAAREIENQMSIGQIGEVFYVDPIASSASDTNTGTSPLEAFENLQAGIDACVADRGDLIIRMRGYDQPSATVNFNKQGITVIAENWGQNYHAQGEYFTTDTSNTDGPAARITAGCHLIGLGFAGVQASGDTDTATVQIDGSSAATDGFGTWLDHCYFTNWDRAAVNYGVVNQGAARVRISNSSFYGGAATNVLDAGILHDESTTGGGGRPGEVDCYKNRYQHCTYAHEVVSGSRVVNSIWDSEMMGFQAVGDVWVKYLKLNVLGGGGAVHGAHIMNNNFATAVGTGTFSHTQAQLITEGYQFSNNHYGSNLSNL